MCWRFQVGSMLGLSVLLSDIQNIACLWATLLTFRRSLLASSRVGKASADTKTCCGLFWTGFGPPWHGRQYFGSLLWQLGINFNNYCDRGGGDYRVVRGPLDRLSRLLAFPLSRRCEYFILFSFPKLFRENVILYCKSLECMYILILIVGTSVSCITLLFLFCVYCVAAASCCICCHLFWNEREQACDLGRQHTIVFRFVQLTNCWLLK
jgi:hypothetical protein